MRILIAEDDLTSRLLLQELLKDHGTVHVTVNGGEAIEAVRIALEKNEPYDLICLDIMMPEVDGHEALKQIRELESARGIYSTDGAKIIMTTALDDISNVRQAYGGLCDAYLGKPIRGDTLKQTVRKLIAES